MGKTSSSSRACPKLIASPSSRKCERRPCAGAPKSFRIPCRSRRSSPTRERRSSKSFQKRQGEESDGSGFDRPPIRFSFAPKNKNDKLHPGFQSTASSRTLRGLACRDGLFVDNRTPTGAERSEDWGYQALLLVDGVADRETLATLGAAAAENRAAPAIFHAGAESMGVVTLAVVRLECSFHSSRPLGNNALPLKNFLELQR